MCKFYPTFIFLSFFFFLLNGAEYVHAQTCEELCASAKEAGVNEISDGENTTPCCCIENGEILESRPLAECENI